MHGPMFDQVIRYQYYQNVPGVMELRVMAAPGFSLRHAEALERAYARKTGAELEIKVTPVSELPLTGRGKLRRLIQEIPQVAAN